MLTRIDRPDGKTIELVVDGKVEGYEYDDTILHLKGKIQKRGKINILEYVKNFDGFDREVLWDNIKFGIDDFQDIERCAVVSDKDYPGAAPDMVDPMLKMEVKTFTPDQLLEAREWCAESPA